MIRVVGGVVDTLVTTVAIGRDGSVVVVDMATGTRHGGVSSGQRETGVVVVEARGTPSRGAMAYVALLRESRGYVVGVFRPIEIIQVAADAGRVGNVVVRVHMTLTALQSGVCASQWPSGRCMIEGRRVPVRRRMADLTLLRKPSCGVVRVIRALEVLQMTSDAARAFQVVVSIGMALGAGYLHMRTGEWEGGLRVVERCRLPT